MSSSVMFTAIPTGFVTLDDGTLAASLSIYVTPQISDTSLSATSPLANWPAVAAGLAFKVLFRSASGPSAIGTLNKRYADNRFDQALWQEIFTPGAPVKPWSVQDHLSSGVLSFKNKEVSAGVKETYRAAAPLTQRPLATASGTDVISRRMKDIASVRAHGPSVGNQVKAAIGLVGSNNKVMPSLSAAALTKVKSDHNVQTTFPETFEFIRAAAFHNVDNYRGLAPTAPATLVAPDFHQILGHLADHPVLLRRLGLVIDLVFTIPTIIPPGQALDGFTSIAVTSTAAVSGLTISRPWTFCLIHPPGSTQGPPTFRPVYGDVDDVGDGRTRPANPFVDANGLVRLDQEGSAFIDDLDVDHAALHVTEAANQIGDALADAPSVEVTLPALRTTGFALHRPDREADVGLRFQNTASWNPDASIFVAENLIRGYRVDVRTVRPDNTVSAWSSLCLRSTSVTFANGHAPIAIPAPDEGFVRSSAMTAADANPIHNVSESLFHWDGWSLVASRPGLAVGPIAGNGEGAVVPTSSGASFTVKVAPQPGSLPRLRFGLTYQFRARAVDLCGNDMKDALGAGVVDRVSPPKTFGRYEPVSPPVFQLRRPLTEGESNEHLVVRSDPYASPPVYADAWAAKNNVAPPGAPAGAPPTMGMNAYYATCERHVAPPKSSVQLAEYHGAIDSAVAQVAPQARASAAWAIVSKEDGTFYDRYITDTTTSQYRTYDQPGRRIVTPPFTAPVVARALASGEPAFTDNQEITPRGTALQPGQYVVFDADTILLPYLPDANASGVAIQGLGASPVFRSYSARATNPSGEAWPELATFRLVLAESKSGLTFSGLASTPSGGTGPASVALPAASVLELAYSSTLANAKLHAFGPADGDPSLANAQRGLLPLLSPQRSLTLVHAVQRPKAPVLRDGDVATFQREEGETSQKVQATIGFDGPSTGRVDLVASWVEYVDSMSAASPGVDPSANPVSHKGIVSTFTPNRGDSSLLETVRQSFGDTKRRTITFSAVATTRFREYFPPTITSDASNITNAATAPTPIICRSSGRPPIPRVLYAVPSFAFNATTSGATTTRTRLGGIVRVYCDRGWFATGEDERLGVVLAASASGGAPVSNLLSVWGNDPIWYRGTLGALNLAHLRATDIASVSKNVTLAEGAGVVDVATYRPSFNAARGLWYFDIGVSPDQAYFPFLRLALVRYQPESVGTLHMSRVVTTDFVQLTADRTASVVDLGSKSYTVSLSGPTAPNRFGSQSGATPAQFASGHTVTAEFQQATTADPDPLDWSSLTTPVTLTPTQVSGVNVTYQATLALPDAATNGTKHRILLREYEIFAADAQDGVREPILGVVRVGEPITSYRTRVVYTDALAISA